MRPAIRIIFAPLFRRNKAEREKGLNTHGETVGRTIKIDPRSTWLLGALIHEITHVNHPDWSEEMVKGYVSIWLKKTGWKRKAAYLKLLGSAIIEGEE